MADSDVKIGYGESQNLIQTLVSIRDQDLIRSPGQFLELLERIYYIFNNTVAFCA